MSPSGYSQEKKTLSAIFPNANNLLLFQSIPGISFLKNKKKDLIFVSFFFSLIIHITHHHKEIKISNNQWIIHIENIERSNLNHPFEKYATNDP